MADDEDDFKTIRESEAPIPDEPLDRPSPPSDSSPMSERPSLSLGPLAMLGFGPKPDSVDGVPGLIPKKTNSLVVMASLVIVIAAIKTARPVLLPLTVAVFLATLTAPAVLYLKKRRVPPEIGVPLVLIMTLVFFSGLGGLVAGTINSFIQASPAYQERLIALFLTTSAQLEKWGMPVTAENLYSLVRPEELVGFLGNTLSSLADTLSNTFLVMLMTVFLLFEALVLPDKIRAALGDPHADMSQGIRVIGRLKAYVVVKTSTSLATGLIIGVALELIGVDFALLWGLFAFLLNFIPNIGSIIAAVPAVLMALLQLGTGAAVATSVVFLITNLVIGSLLEPKIMGQRMNLSPLVVFVSLVFWGWLWGGMGMLLSVPLTMAIRIMLDGNESTRPFAILMAGANPTTNSATQSSFEDTYSGSASGLR